MALGGIRGQAFALLGSVPHMVTLKTGLWMEINNISCEKSKHFANNPVDC